MQNGLLSISAPWQVVSCIKEGKYSYFKTIFNITLAIINYGENKSIWLQQWQIRLHLYGGF